MSDRYSVEILTPIIIPVIVVANSFQEARERALQGEGNAQEQRTEEPVIKSITRLED